MSRWTFKSIAKNQAEGASLIVAKGKLEKYFPRFLFQNFNPHKIDMRNGDSFMNNNSSGLYELGSVSKPLIMA